MDFSHYLEETALGPLQRTEAEFLYNLLRVTKPNNIVEFGFFKGDSTTSIIEATKDYKPYITSFDISYNNNMEILKSQHNNFNYYVKSQTEFNITDLQDNNIDFIFIDASHDFEINKETFEKIKNHITDNCLILVHDTGLWERKFMLPIHFNFNGEWVNEEQFAHQPHEIVFVNWLKNKYNFNKIDLHSRNCIRHGFTILQK